MFDVRDPSWTTLVQNEPVTTGIHKIREKSLFRSGVHARITSINHLVQQGFFVV
jgi:hypothetical protein